MSVLRAGNTTLEDGKVRICVPIAYETEKEILEESVRSGKSRFRPRASRDRSYAKPLDKAKFRCLECVYLIL